MKKYYLLLFLFGLVWTTGFSQNKPIVQFSAGSQIANVGDTVCIPVTVNNFQDVLGVGLGMRWNAAALTFIEVQTGFALPENMGSNFGVTESDLKWSWIASTFPDGISLEENDTLFQVCFVANAAAAGNFYSITFDDNFLLPEVILDDQIYAEPLANYNFVPGGIFINGNSNLTLKPAFDFSLGCNTYNASIDAGASGGLAPYRYAWRGPQSIFSNAGRLNNITREGLYTLTVTDADNNTATAEIIVNFMGNESGLPFPIITSVINKDPDCGESNGSIELEVDENSTAYEIEWSTGVSGTLALEGLAAGNYDVTLTSTENFCGDSFEFILEPIGTPDVDTVLSNLTCLGDTVEIGIIGLNDRFSYEWNTGATTNLIKVTEAGDYNLLVSDGICSQSYLLEVQSENNPPNPNNFIVFDEDLPCGGGSSRIGVTYFGLRNLQYRWSTGDTLSKIDVDTIGTYSLEVFGDNGCITTFKFEIGEEPADFALRQEAEYLGCQIGQTQLSLVAQDNRSYDFSWNTGQTAPSINVSTAAIYSVTVTETGTSCTEVYEFDLEQIDPTQIPISYELTCQIEDNCYQGSALTVAIEGAVAPVTYTLSNGISAVGPSNITIDIYDREPFDVYIEDANGCRDTLLNLVADCALAGNTPEMRVRQYIVCKENETTGQVESVLFNEVLGNLPTPPYRFTWGNNFVDTSYFRSSQPLDSLPNIFISVVDQQGNRFDRQLSEPPAAYTCGDETTTVISANDVIVAPGEQFVYPVYINNHQGLERAVYTIDWDPCLLTVDSIIFYTGDGDTVLYNSPFPGTDETFYFATDGSTTNESTLLQEIYFHANGGLQGISPFLFSINEIPENADGSNRMMRPKHGSIIVSDGSDLINPGDANLNGLANHKDVLNIGLAYQVSGPDRRNQRIDKQDFAYPWLKTTPQSKVDFRNIDCNGDGLINQRDLQVIEQNFKYVPQPGKGNSVDGEIPLYLEADTLYIGQTQSFPIIFGETLLPANDVYGMAFSIQYDPNIIASESIQLDLQNSWLIKAEDTPLVFLQVDEVNQLIHIAISRTDLINQSGIGQVANLIFETIAAEAGNTTFQVTDATIIAADETELLSLNLLSNASVQTSTSIKNIQALSRKVKLYPNPVESKLYIDTDGLQISNYSIFDANGRQVKQGIFDKNIIDVQNLRAGMYVLRLVTEQGVITKKIIK